MPGANLNLTIPSESDNMATFRAKVATALLAIEADLAPRIPAGALNLTTDVSLGGAALLNVGGLRLVGGESAEIGTLYMDEELHAVTSAGDVQLTLNGGLNFAALGTIGGDYGGANPAAVIYDDLSGEFRFYHDESPVDWARLVAGELRLEGANGSVRLFVDDAVATAREIGVKSLPTSGVSGLVYNAATSTIEDAAVTRETNTHLFTGINCSGNAHLETLTHGEMTQVVPLLNSSVCTGMSQTAGDPTSITSSSAVFHYHSMPLPGLRLGSRVKSARFRFSGNTGNVTVTAAIRHFRYDGGVNEKTVTSTATQSHLTVTLDPVTDVTQNQIETHDTMLDVMTVRFSGSAVGIKLEGVNFTHDHP